LKHGPSAWRAGVECLLMKVQIATEGLELSQEAHQILQTSAKPIYRRRDHIDLAPGGVRLFDTGPLIAGRRYPKLHDLGPSAKV